MLQSQIEWHDEIDSTNRRAKELFSSEPSIQCVAAEMQSRGRGTRDRSFYSPAGGGLYLSVLHRGVIPTDRLVRITPLAAVAVCRALADCGVKGIWIKWVNDLLLGGKKICGILTEPQWTGNTCIGAVIGIGINLTTTDFPLELAEIATSVKAETGLCLPCEAVMGRVLYHLRALLLASNDADSMREYRDRSVLIGKQISVHTASGTKDAAVTGIDDAGGLCVRYRNGETAVLRSGEVSLSKE